MNRAFDCYRAGIPKERRELLRTFVAWLRETRSPRHTLVFEFDASTAVGSDERGWGFGYFTWPNRPPVSFDPQMKLTIVIAALMPEVCVKNGLTIREGTEAMLHTVAHEFAHYGQWACGAKPSERGANVSATATMKRWARHELRTACAPVAP